ncbi:MAG: phosphatidate cytidylyltransferase [Saprospiraceae bacterium]
MDVSVLKTRITTAAVFGIFVIGSLLLGKVTTMLLLAIIGLGCTWEYLRMVIKDQPNVQWVGIICFLILLGTLFLFDIPQYFVKGFIMGNGIAFLIISRHLWHPYLQHEKVYTQVVLVYIMVPILLTCYVLFYEMITSINLLFILLLIWMADSGAYFIGSLWGKHKLFEKISPKKTWEGFVGGGFLTVGLAFLLNYLTENISLSQWLLLALVVWIFGTIGDLFESSIKRNFQVKDSGTFLPGHGGFLDRFDSFIFVLPFALYILIYL